MTVCSTVSPESVILVKLENNIATYKLRQNITETTVENTLIGTSDKLYSYDELTLQVTYVENIEQQLKDNFSTYWTLASEQETQKKELETKKQQIENLIGNYGQLEINKNQQNMINSLVDTIVTMSMNTMQ